MNIQEWNEQGLIPGPEETEEAFIRRAQFCLGLTQELHRLGTELPFEASDQASKKILEGSSGEVSHLYGIAPSWIPLFFSNYQLAPWHGGCAWIFQLNEQTPTAALMQLRAQFRRSSSYLGIYKRDELIAHELCHVGRMMYEEPQFEELLAYQTSSSRWRRWFGPIVQSSKETLIFILLLGFFMMASIALFIMDHPASYRLLAWLQAGLISLVGIACARLAWRHWQFQRCLKRLSQVYENHQTARHILYRLTDKEIRLFASLPPEKVKGFIQEQSTFRWRFLRESYPLTA